MCPNQSLYGKDGVVAHINARHQVIAALIHDYGHIHPGFQQG